MNSANGHILLVEDDERLAALTEDYLANSNFTITVERNGAQAVERIRTLQPDLVILDLMLPGEDGLSICRRVRSDYFGPILMLTARNDDTDEILGLEMGADDYVTKPVMPRVLLARVHALLRRFREDDGATPKVHRLEFHDLVIDSNVREAWLNAKRIDLTSAEFDLLWLLASHAGRVLSREEIYTHVRGTSYDGQDRSIDVRISRVRAKVGDDPQVPQRIKTVRSKGYLFVKDLVSKPGECA